MTGEHPRQSDSHEDDVARAMRLDVEAPDLTDSILDRVSMHRTFIDRRTRRWLWATRVAIAASVLLVAGVIVLVHERYPQVRGEAPRPRPLSTVVAAAQGEARRLEGLSRFEIPEAPAPRLADARLTISVPGPIAPKQPADVVLVTGAGEPQTIGLPIFAEPAVTSRRFADVAVGDRVALRERLEFPSATEAVHRWAITADAPVTPRLLRWSGPEKAPLLLQGPISDEIRLPR